MRIAIIQFPGSNCERETTMAVARVGMEPVEFLWNDALAKLESCDGFIIVGGFSYEDRSRAGIIAALDPVMLAIKTQSELGKPVLGICNGAQVLVETGLVPGLENNKVAMALTENKRVQNGKVLGTGYYNAWVNMRLSDNYQRNAFTKHLTPADILSLPVAHGEGRFVIPPALLQELTEQGLALFQYCNEAGEIIDSFPINPNGSVHNIAAVSNKAGNVLAMMPHPERTQTADAIFASMRDFISAKHFQPVHPLHYYPRKEALKSYQPTRHARTLTVELIITDNQAKTVEQTLNRLGFPVTVTRFQHYEIQCESEESYQKILKSGVLFNDRKERLSVLSDDAATRLLVRAKEDWLGLEKKQLLVDHFDVNDLQAISHSTLWQIQAKSDVSEIDLHAILDTHIFANPYAYDMFKYDSGV